MNPVNLSPTIYTITDAMVKCGVNNIDLFDGQTAARRFSSDIFSDSFDICMDKTMEEVQNDLKHYSNLTQAQGQIRITPGVIQRIQAFIQWTRDMIRVGLDPSLTEFPVESTALLITHYKTHKAFVDKTKTISEAAKPIKFKENMKWEDWYPTFINFLRSIPGRNGVPLSYICREYDRPEPNNPNINFIENYITQAPLYGPAFDVDASEVHTYLTNFMAGNDTAEVKMLPYAQYSNGRLDYKALQEHYEGVGVNSVSIVKAEKTLESLFYSGEKKPHMWWDEFEKQLNHAFTIIHKRERREVYSDEMKLRMLIQKVNVDFLQGVKSAMSIELTREPLMMTYDQAMMTFRNEINRKFPPGTVTNNRTRRVNEVSTGPRYNQAGRGRGRGRGGRGGGRGRGMSSGVRTGRGRGNNRGHPNARFITGTNGRTLEIHPSYNFPPEIWNVIPPNEKRKIIEERNNYSNKRQRISAVQYAASVPPAISVNQGQHDASSVAGSMAGSSVGRNAETNSQANEQQSTSIMGGRNEQASLRSRNTHYN